MITQQTTFEIRSGYKRSETMMVRNPIDVEEMDRHCTANSHIWLRDLQGNARMVKVNGAVRRWKRDRSRIEVPFKYGMYGYGTLTARNICDVLIPIGVD